MPPKPLAGPTFAAEMMPYARLVYVALLLGLPTVATLQLPAHAAEPGPRSRRSQQQHLSRGDVLRGALAAAATWVSPHADVPSYCAYVPAARAGYAYRPAACRACLRHRAAGAPRCQPRACRSTRVAAPQASPLAGRADESAPAAEAVLKANGMPDKIIGEIPASGLIFKDIVKVSRFSDPKVQGVELYVSDFQLPMTERLTQGDIFSDPLSSSVTCVQTGAIVLDPSIKAENTLQGEEVVSQARSLLFKSVKVRRLYDEETNTIVYVSFASRLDKGDDANKSRFKSDICVLKVDQKFR